MSTQKLLVPMPHDAAPKALSDEAVAAVFEEHDVPPDGLGAVDAEFRHEMISTAAYYLAEQRGFAPGHDLEDWMAAERAVDRTLRRLPAAKPTSGLGI